MQHAKPRHPERQAAPPSTPTAPQTAAGPVTTVAQEQLGSPGSNTTRTRPSQGELVQRVAFPAPYPLIDIGANLVDASFQKDLPGVLQRARDAGVACIIVTGTCVRTSRAAARLCEAHSHRMPLYFTAGVHPHNAKNCTAATMDELRALAAHPRCVAIGECGLDFNRNFSPQDVQLSVFSNQVALAKQLRRPLFLHCRDATAAFLSVLRAHLPLPAPAVVHCFTGSAAELDQLLELPSVFVGVTGWICDDRPERGGAELAALLPRIPRSRLMIETDAPYLVPRSIKPSKARPGRNEPALLPHVLAAAAAAVGVPPAELAASTTAVACEVFGIPLDEVLAVGSSGGSGAAAAVGGALGGSSGGS